MRVILDSNVVVAAFASRGLCASLFELCLLDHRIILGEDLLEEISRNLSKKIKLPPATIDEIISVLKNQAEISKPKKLSTRVSRDPDDDAVLGLAIATNSDYIITGDDDLLSLKEFQTIPIISPRGFWELLKKVKK